MTPPSEGEKLRIAYIAGPADGPALYREWLEGGGTNFFGTDYMKEFFRLSRDLGAQSHVVTWAEGGRAVERRDDLVFDNRPLRQLSGIRHHLVYTLWFARLLPALIRFRPHVLLLTGNYNYWWVLAPLRWSGTAFLPSYHGAVWRRFGPVRPSWRALVRLNRRFVLKHAKFIVAASAVIRTQLEELLRSQPERPRIVTHLPTYSPAHFASIQPPPEHARRPFRVMFLGRIVADKGVYDLLEVARRLKSERKGEFRFELCGSGYDFERFKARIKDFGLEGVMICHGFCGPEKIRELLSLSHACIVPTRSEIEVGFEMTCAEAILAGRPLITSAVCPALDYVRDATVEVRPDNVDDYQEALLLLSRDQQLYEAKCQASIRLQGQFYDPSNSWYSAVRRCLVELGPSRSVSNARG